MADDNAAHVHQFLDIALAERKVVIQPQGVTDDAQREGGDGGAYGQSRTISVLRLSCQNR